MNLKDDRTLTSRGLLFAVVADKLDLFSAKSRLKKKNQRLLRATSWYELFAPLSNLQSGVFCKGYTFVRQLHAPEKLLCL